MTRRYDPRRARLHLSYTRLDLCQTFDVGLSTISAWKRKGLQPIDNHRPYLFAGAVVREFIEQHNKPYHSTAPGEFYCVACKHVTKPSGDVVDFIQLNHANGNLVGTCPRCSRRMPQRVRNADVARKAGHLKVRYEDGSATLPRCGGPSRNERAAGEAAQ